MILFVKGALSQKCMLQFLKLKLEKFSLNFSGLSVNFKMVLTSGGSKQINSGLKRIFEKYSDSEGYLNWIKGN